MKFTAQNMVQPHYLGLVPQPTRDRWRVGANTAHVPLHQSGRHILLLFKYSIILLSDNVI